MEVELLECDRSSVNKILSNEYFGGLRANDSKRGGP